MDANWFLVDFFDMLTSLWKGHAAPVRQSRPLDQELLQFLGNNTLPSRMYIGWEWVIVFAKCANYFYGSAIDDSVFFTDFGVIKSIFQFVFHDGQLHTQERLLFGFCRFGFYYFLGFIRFCGMYLEKLLRLKKVEPKLLVWNGGSKSWIDASLLASSFFRHFVLRFLTLL